MSYCSAVRTTAIDEWNRVYHDTEYGFPLASDAELFERLMLEINQAGLSWLTILKKREGFRNAYAGFEVRNVARFGDKDRERLMADASIIRNRLKIDAGGSQRPGDPATRGIRQMAGRRAPAPARTVEQAVPQNLPFHRRGDRPRISGEHRLSAERARP